MIDPIRKFLAAYDRYAVNGLRPGLADECYAVDGGDHVEGGASLKISDLRAIVKSHDALMAAMHPFACYGAETRLYPFRQDDHVEHSLGLAKLTTGDFRRAHELAMPKAEAREQPA